ncbi:serine hydrolase domain-containing protein [Cohnella nanjingensis]|uniref:Serine hydrolase n=1 Tax=Cohnella nanjingensis TaxID=1387779 RepID=A0A7X0VES8_9BACL|nr:serine hydrolase [Cohnella nanjingensis]MBB6671335.1 serine hydrolase [Cohnella nanjingensis]
MGNTDLIGSAPEREGVSSRGLAAFLEALDGCDQEIDAFVLLRHGRIIAEGGWAPYSSTLPRLSNSVSKSFASTAIGMAVAEGLLSVEDQVIAFFPDQSPSEPSEHLAAMRVKHLLTMSTGHQVDTLNLFEQELALKKDWVRTFLHAPVEEAPGTRFLYNSGATYMLSAILQRVTGMTLFDYAKPRLFEPLGIREATWQTCPLGITVGGWGLSISAESYAKFGQLYLNKGTWNGERLLSEAWIEEATGVRIATAAQPDEDHDWAQGYGYQFWRCRHGAFRADGAFGQFILILPRQDAVFAFTSAMYESQPILDLIWAQLLPLLEGADGPLAPDPEGERLLQETAASLRIAAPREIDRSATEPAVDGRRYAFEANGLGLREATVTCGEEEVVLAWTSERGEAQVRFGRGAWVVNGSTDDRAACAASATWTSDGTLKLTIRPLRTAYVNTIEIRFDREGEAQIAIKRDYDVFVSSLGSWKGRADG